ncbi:MAG: hypothetical protein JST54_03535 [Deltaproteobacteria bacterium]|nr:hypothetical protein [Deltaproteobacteria bacterium]
MSQVFAAQTEPLWVRAAQALEPRSTPMGLTEFWREVVELGWGSRHQDAEACGVSLAARLGPTELVAFKLRLRQLDAQLARAIELWEMQNEESLGLPRELAGALREHVIGQGEIPYGAAVQGPWRVKHRADRDDYLEGFGRVVDEALKHVPQEKLLAVIGS